MAEDTPTPADVPAKPDKAKTAPVPELLTVGHFRHRDHLLGGVHDRFGVVVAVDGQALTVTPLEGYTLTVDAGEFTALTPADVSGETAIQ